MSNNIEIDFIEMNTNDDAINTPTNFIPVTAGSRNEEGFINGLNRQGFTPTKCGMEKIANCIDAYANNIQFQITSTCILLCDDGIGMTPEKLCNMFDANRENHSGDKSMGVSGIGGIISNYQLSKSDDGIPREVIVFTKNKDERYIKAIIPWDFIHAHKKYDDTIKIKLMDETEINLFIMERQNFTNLTGTTIRFPYSESFRKLLCLQFISKQEDGRNLENWWPIIFGKTQTNILLDKCDGLQAIPLKKYNYFSGSDTEFYYNVFNWPIYFISDNGKDRFISQNPNNLDEYIEIIQNGSGFSTLPKPIKIDPRKIENAQIIQFTCGMRKDNRVFNPEYPLNQGTLSATFYLNKYDAQFMSESGQKDVIKEFCSKIGVIRNSQKVTGFTLEGCSVGSARGNVESLIKNVLHRSEISYETFSKQENKLDIIHGIQQNKNQNQNEFPTQYVRLIKYLKELHYAKIMKYFKEVTDLAEKKLNDDRIRKKAEQERIRAEQKAEEDRKKAEQKAEEDRKKAEQKAEEDRKKAETSAAALQQKAEEEENDSNEEEDDSSVEEEDNSSVEEEDNSSVEEEDNSSVEEEVEEDDNLSVEEEEDMNKFVVESREWEKQAAQLLMEHIAGINYNKTNGKEIYDFVMQYLNKK
jgi:hypothetical protein